MAGKNLMLRVGRMSFEEGMKNNEIAKLLLAEGVLKTKSTAERKVQELVEETGKWLLQEQARLAAIESADTPDRKLAASLCDKFGLLDARVVPGGSIHSAHDYVALIKRYGQAAADYFEDVTSEAEQNDEELHVSLSGGQPILDMVSALPDRHRPNVHYYAAAIIGRGIRNHTPNVSSVTNATVAWARSGRIPDHIRYGTVPPYQVDVDTLREINGRKERHAYGRKIVLEQMKRLCETQYVTDALDTINENVNMAIAGLGIIHPVGIDEDYGAAHIARVCMTGLLKPFGIEPEILAAEKAVGDIAYCLFDEKGQGRKEWSFFITAGERSKNSGVDFYRYLVAKGKKVIVIAGARKESALIPALKFKLFNVLITDAVTAQRLLKA